MALRVGACQRYDSTFASLVSMGLLQVEMCGRSLQCITKLKCFVTIGIVMAYSVFDLSHNLTRMHV